MPTPLTRDPIQPKKYSWNEWLTLGLSIRQSSLPFLQRQKVILIAKTPSFVHWFTGLMQIIKQRRFSKTLLCGRWSGHVTRMEGSRHPPCSVSTLPRPKRSPTIPK
eukprot:Lithocolla_globosa_v1_NODE_4565_length_1409_cov_4.884047.p2 type:complete len:106 gc:universal NODE_4565_length_1409_cov_4.884047:1396-1079(-)